MFQNPDFSFPARNTTNTVQQHQSRSSIHRRQFSTSSNPPLSPTHASSVSSRPASGHHRRQSSVSSRRESREVMGIPSLPDTHSDDHINTVGGIDSRQRALWALEGKRASSGAGSSTSGSAVMLGFSKVELPDWNTPDVEKDVFSWSPASPSGSSSTKPLHTPLSSPNSIGGISPSGSATSFTSFSHSNVLGNKRDSFGKSLLPPSSSLKKELHTLLEEDEDEEPEETETEDDREYFQATEALPSDVEGDDGQDEQDDESESEGSQDAIVPETQSPVDLTPSPTNLVAPQVVPNTVSSPPRPRPPVLTLRPLSLVSTISHSPRLKSLTLATNLQQNTTTPNSNASTPTHFTNSITPLAGRRHSLLNNTPVAAPLTPSPSPHAGSSSLSSLSSSQSSSLERQPLRRRSSIGYRRESELSIITPSRRPTRISSTLPMTPGLTPTSVRSVSPSTPSESFSSSRASSEFFHTQAVSSLLSRIASLEEALQTAQGFPPSSLPLTPESACNRRTSDDSDADELISVIADLKAERDELNNDVGGWRMRCSDLETSRDMLGKRLAEETQQLWASRERTTHLEVECQRLQADVAVERRAIGLEKKSRSLLEESVNSERTEWAKEGMRFQSERLKWAKEKRGWDAEKELLQSEVRQLEEALEEREDEVDRLEKRIAELERINKNANTPTLGDLTMTPKAVTAAAKGLWAGGKDGVLKRGFSFPMLLPTPSEEHGQVLDRPPPIETHGQVLDFPPRSPAVAESPVNSRPPLRRGLGALDLGFKFGGAASKAVQASSVDVGPVVAARDKDASPTDKDFALGVVAEEDDHDEEEDNGLQGYEDEEDGDELLDSNDSEVSSEEHDREDRTQRLMALAALDTPSSPAPAPSPVTQPQHGHRRSASKIAKWRFPSMSRRAPPTPPKPVDVDLFFSCLDDTAENQPVKLVGKELKLKEHKKLPSGCPAFWLDCDEVEETTVSLPTSLPTPAITEEEDNAESEAGDLPSHGTSSPSMPSPLVPQPTTMWTSPPSSRQYSVTRPAATRVSLTSRKSSGPMSPDFIPYQALPASSPARTSVRSIPPAASPAMAVPPSLRVQAYSSPASSAPSSRPSSSRSTGSSDFFNNNSLSSSTSSLVPPSPPPVSSFAARLSSLISWSTPKAAPPPRSTPPPLCLLNEDDTASTGTITTTHTPTASVSASSPGAKIRSTSKSSFKLVDPTVMRARLKAQLEHELSSRKAAAAGTSQTDPCGKCLNNSVVEL